MEESPSMVLKLEKSLLFILLALATALRVWLACHTEVTSRDSIGFERYAWELGRDDWKDVLSRNVHHPLYPLTILGVSLPVRLAVNGPDVDIMQLSAQLASGLAGILLVLPMFYLGKDLFDRRVGFWATALFQCLPVGARVMSDALSESLFLLLTATALLVALWAFRTGASRLFVLCGCCAGLAYLARPEGVLIVVAVAMVLFGRQVRAFTLGSWLGMARCLAALVIAWALVAGPYMCIIGGFSNKTTTQDVLRTAKALCPSADRSLGASPMQFPPVAALVGIWWPDGKQSDLQGHLWWSLYALGSEIGKGFFYFAWIPAILGLVMMRARRGCGGGEAVMIVLCLLQCVALLRVAMVAGYVSDRHILVIVMCGLFWAAKGTVALTESLKNHAGIFAKACPSASLLCLILAGAALPKTLEPLHANRAGHHAVGLWLAKHITPADELDDPFCWAAHYAGRTFCHAGGPVANAPGSEQFPGTEESEVTTRFRYVVHECRPDHRERFRKPTVPVADLISAEGQVVYHWPEEEPLEAAKIVLFAVPIPGTKCQDCIKEP